MTIRERTPKSKREDAVDQSLKPRLKDKKERQLLQERAQWTRAKFIACVEADPPVPGRIASPDSEMTQLYATLLSLYMPKSGGDQISLRSFLAVASSSEALLSSAKAFSLLIVGRAIDDPHLLLAASASYSVALKKAHREIASPETSKCIVFGIGQCIHYALCQNPMICTCSKLGSNRLIMP